MKINQIQKELKKSDLVVIPTDKTNSTQLVKIDDYVRWMNNHLKKSANEITRDKVVEFHRLSVEKFNDIKDLLSKNEKNFLLESINSKAIPTPKLLIKDHKKMVNNEYSTRLVVPANNFTAIFSKLGYIALKAILDENNIKYDKFTIVQVSDMKQKVEELKIKKYENTIASIDIVNFYPSTRISLIKKAIKYYTMKLSNKKKKKFIGV